MRNQVMPGARMVWTVTMKLSPVRMEEKPAMKMPSAVAITQVLEYVVLDAVEKVQPVSTPPAIMAKRLNAPPITSRYQLSRLSLGNARSRAPIMIGRKKFPSTAGIDGIRKKKIIDTACMVNSLL